MQLGGQSEISLPIILLKLPTSPKLFTVTESHKTSQVHLCSTASHFCSALGFRVIGGTISKVVPCTSINPSKIDLEYKLDALWLFDFNREKTHAMVEKLRFSLSPLRATLLLVTVSLR
uniref:Uncharacterized protein n=1 Tax=Cannabis sativa TaxID=3483 RepID=A0A803P7C7_CANSA